MNTQTLTFSATQRAALEALRSSIVRRIGRPVELDTSAEDGDEWALFSVPDADDRGPVTLASVQLTDEPSRSLVILDPAGCEVSSSSDADLKAMVRAASSVAGRSFRQWLA